MYNVVTTIKNNIRCTQYDKKKIELKCSHCTHTHRRLHEGVGVRVQISNFILYTLNIYNLHLSIISQ